MKMLLPVLSAVCAYLISGLNPAIILSTLIYHRDIRSEGSGNPGFTNFRRAYGDKYAWWVFVLDIGKAVLPEALFGLLFADSFGSRQLGTAWTAVFCLLGHAYPCWYSFRGGKGFLVCFATAWMLDLRVGLIASAVLVILLLSTEYMSLSTICAMLCAAAALFLLRAQTSAALLFTGCTLFMIFRHRENLKRLKNGTESHFVLFKKH